MVCCLTDFPAISLVPASLCRTGWKTGSRTGGSAPLSHETCISTLRLFFAPTRCGMTAANGRREMHYACAPVCSVCLLCASTALSSYLVAYFMLTTYCMFMVCSYISMRLCSQMVSMFTAKSKSRRSYSQLASSALSRLHLTSVDRKVWILWVACGSSVLCLLTAIHTNN